MANVIMNTIYNHYMTTYSPKKTDARLDSHNKSELKNIYGKIVKMNKEAPLYIFDQSKQTTSFALALKENTRQLQHTILNSAGSKGNSLFDNKEAFSSDENVVSARYIGEGTTSPEETLSLEFSVHNLASGQMNMGKFLQSDKQQTLGAGTYAFDIKLNDYTYEFQFAVNDEDTNADIQSRLAHLINQANLGLEASVIHGENDLSSLKIESLQTGESLEPGTPLFTIESSVDDFSEDIVDYLGIDYIARESSNAHFSINGEETSTASNRFTIDDTYEITLNGISSTPDESVNVGLKTNVDSLTSNIRNLISGYNTFLQAADQYKTLVSSNKLSYEIQSVAKLFRNELDAVGINLTRDGSLSLDDNLLTQTAESEDAYALLSPLRDFSSSLFKKGEEISRDPLGYANRKLVAYKNPGKNFPSPYATSSYSGLLFNFYC